MTGPGRPQAACTAAAARSYRALPAELRQQIPEHGSRRVLRAMTAELTHRTPAELATRIADRWEVWRYRPEDITDPTAVAITVVRRGYHCPDVRCEDHHRLDTGQPCGHCEQESHNEALSAPQATEQTSPGGSLPPEPPRRPTGPLSAPTPPAGDSVKGAGLARKLLAERNKIISEAEQDH